MNAGRKDKAAGLYWVYELQDEEGFSEDKAAALIGQGIGQITRHWRSQYVCTAGNCADGKHHPELSRSSHALGIPAIVHEEVCNGYLAREPPVFHR